MTQESQHLETRWQQAFIIGACLLLIVSLLSVGLVVFAVQQRVVSLPAFSVRLGHMQFGGPCPSPAFQCDVNPNYYAIWRGDDQPDGSIKFHQIYFTYLPVRH